MASSHRFRIEAEHSAAWTMPALSKTKARATNNLNITNLKANGLKRYYVALASAGSIGSKQIDRLRSPIG
jgi:hypothetical protein